jgi:hypothetical protein
MLTTVQTDLIPPVTKWTGYSEKDLEFVNGDPFNFLARIIQQEDTIESHCLIAKTMTGQPWWEPDTLVSDEFQKAIALAEKKEDIEKLKEVYFLCVSSLTMLEYADCEQGEVALLYAEKYLALDPNDWEMQARLGVIRWCHKHDIPSAIEAFRISISLEPKVHMVFRLLIDALFEVRDYDEIMQLFQSEDRHLTIRRLRSVIGKSSIQRHLFLAARNSGKEDFIISLYEQAIAKPWSEIDDNGDWPVPRGRKDYLNVFNLRKNYSAGRAVLQCRLGEFYLVHLGKPQLALTQWSDAFLKNLDIFSLTDIPGGQSRSTFPELFGEFAELLHNQAFELDGSVNEGLFASLNSLKQRRDAIIDRKDSSRADGLDKSISILLARLYLQRGDLVDSQHLLNEQLKLGIEILKDDVEWNDSNGYHILSKILFISGRVSDADIAQSLRRFELYDLDDENATIAESSKPSLDNDSEKNRWDRSKVSPREYIQCSQESCCPNGDDWVPVKPLYSCRTCLDVNFCESCYDQFLKNYANVEKPYLHLCHVGHQHVKTPQESWTLRDDIMTIGGTKITVKSWLEKIEKEWGENWNMTKSK